MKNPEDAVTTLRNGSEENASAANQHDSSILTVKLRMNNGVLVDETTYQFPCFIRASADNMPHAIEHLMHRFDATAPFHYRILPPSIIRTNWMEAVVWYPDDGALEVLPEMHGAPTYWFTSMALAQLRTNMMVLAKEEADPSQHPNPNSAHHSAETSQKRSGERNDEDENLLKKARH